LWTIEATVLGNPPTDTHEQTDSGFDDVVNS
jgi:hypothetical protein